MFSSFPFYLSSFFLCRVWRRRSTFLFHPAPSGSPPAISPRPRRLVFLRGASHITLSFRRFLVRTFGGSEPARGAGEGEGVGGRRKYT